MMMMMMLMVMVMVMVMLMVMVMVMVMVIAPPTSLNVSFFNILPPLLTNQLAGMDACGIPPPPPQPRLGCVRLSRDPLAHA